jgi:hypothetical protein
LEFGVWGLGFGVRCEGWWGSSPSKVCDILLLVLWFYGSVVLWFCGSMVLWFYDYWHDLRDITWNLGSNQVDDAVFGFPILIF